MSKKSTTQLPAQPVDPQVTALLDNLGQVQVMSQVMSPFAHAGTLPRYLVDWQRTTELLSNPFHPDDLYFLPQGSGKLRVAAVYATPRVYTQRLNEVIGVGFWQSEVTHIHSTPYTKSIKAKTDYETKAILEPARDVAAQTAGVVVRVGIYMGPILGWVWQDSTGSEDTADANWVTTAEAQAYKRAATKWGPGNYFYDFPKTQYAYDGKNNKWLDQPSIPEWAYPKVYCHDCTNQIEGFEYTTKDHVTHFMKAWDVSERGLQSYGVRLCVECSKKRRAAASVPAEIEARLTAA